MHRWAQTTDVKGGIPQVELVVSPLVPQVPFPFVVVMTRVTHVVASTPITNNMLG